jgi:hypothetical protein
VFLHGEVDPVIRHRIRFSLKTIVSKTIYIVSVSVRRDLLAKYILNLLFPEIYQPNLARDDKSLKCLFLKNKRGEKIMQSNFSRLFTALAAFIMLAAFADTNSAQRRAGRAVYSQQQVEQLLERIEERTDAFSNQLNKSLDRSRLDGTRSEDNIAERVSELENATDELRREYDHNDTRGENRPEAQKILNTATEVNRIMNARNFSGQAENAWISLRTELNILARVYGLPAVGARSYRFVPIRNNTGPRRNTVPARRPTIIRSYSQQQVEELLERIEERADAFTEQLNKSLDRSRLDGTRREDNIAELGRDLGDSTDELRREFDHNDTRGENLPEAQRILSVASNVDRLLRSRNFGGQTESTWAALRSELNVLARLYGLQAVGSRSYR